MNYDAESYIAAELKFDENFQVIHRKGILLQNVNPEDFLLPNHLFELSEDEEVYDDEDLGVNDEEDIG